MRRQSEAATALWLPAEPFGTSNPAENTAARALRAKPKRCRRSPTRFATALHDTQPFPTVRKVPTTRMPTICQHRRLVTNRHQRLGVYTQRMGEGRRQRRRQQSNCFQFVPILVDLENGVGDVVHILPGAEERA